MVERFDLESLARILLLAVGPLATVLLTVVALVHVMRSRRGVDGSRAGLRLAAAPSVVMALGFHSLALHMHRALGGWPATLGDAGFPPLLKAHASMVFVVVQVLFLTTVLLWPGACLLCLWVRRWQAALPYLVVHSVTFAVGFASLFLAPSGFLRWWWD